MIPASGFGRELARPALPRIPGDGVLLFLRDPAVSPLVTFKYLILNNKLWSAERARHCSVAQPSSTICVFFAQHLFEIAQTGL